MGEGAMNFIKRKNKSIYTPKVFSVIPKSSQQTVTVQKPFDVYLFFTTLILVLIGIMMIFSSSAILAKEKYGDTYYFLKKQLLFIIVGFGALFACRSLSYKRYEKWIINRRTLEKTIVEMLEAGCEVATQFRKNREIPKFKKNTISTRGK
jgi:hypothetical protein